MGQAEVEPSWQTPQQCSIEAPWAVRCSDEHNTVAWCLRPSTIYLCEQLIRSARLVHVHTMAVAARGQGVNLVDEDNGAVRLLTRSVAQLADVPL